MMPVHHRVVEAELQAFGVAGVGERTEQVFAAGRDADVPIIIHGRGPKTKAIVVLGGDAHIFYPGSLHQAHPFKGIIIGGVPGSGQLAVLGAGNFQIVLNPLGTARDGLPLPFSGQLRIKPPMNKHSKLRLAEPLHARVMFRSCFMKGGGAAHWNFGSEVGSWCG